MNVEIFKLELDRQISVVLAGYSNLCAVIRLITLAPLQNSIILMAKCFGYAYSNGR